MPSGVRPSQCSLTRALSRKAERPHQPGKQALHRPRHLPALLLLPPLQCTRRRRARAHHIRRPGLRHHTHQVQRPPLLLPQLRQLHSRHRRSRRSSASQRSPAGRIHPLARGIVLMCASAVPCPCPSLFLSQPTATTRQTARALPSTTIPAASAKVGMHDRSATAGLLRRYLSNSVVSRSCHEQATKRRDSSR